MATLYDTPHVVFDETTKSHSLQWTPTPMDIIRRQVTDMIAADREGKVRQALIELGWTPPKIVSD